MFTTPAYVVITIATYGVQQLVLTTVSRHSVFLCQCSTEDQPTDNSDAILPASDNMQLAVPCCHFFYKQNLTKKKKTFPWKKNIALRHPLESTAI